MKTSRFAFPFLLSLAVACASGRAGADTVTNYNFTGIASAKTVKGDEVWLLATNDIPMKAEVTIAKGAKLTIVPAPDSPYDEHVLKSTSSGSLMFGISTGGQLNIIPSSEGKRVTLSGNYQLTVTQTVTNGISYLTSETALAVPKGKSARTAALIRNQGGLYLKDVTIQDAYSANSERVGKAAGILHDGADNPSTVVDGCTIQRCRASIGTAIYATPDSTGTIGVTNTIVRTCVACNSSDDEACGIIRSYGTSKAFLSMCHSVISNCYGHYRGSGLYWLAEKSARGCMIDGCEFSYNWGRLHGGGVAIAGAVVFTNHVTTVHHNHSEKNGGGMYLYLYDGVAAEGTKAHNEVLLRNLLVYGNTCKLNGGGIAIGNGIDRPSTLAAGSSFTVTMEDSVVVSNNVAVGDGGGIWLKNTSSKASCRLVFPHGAGKIVDNRATNGGGFYSYQGDMTFDSMVVTGNVASKDGGGICCVQNTDFTSGGGRIDGNSATNGFGGGICLADGTCTAGFDGEVTFSGNRAACGGGGAIVGKSTLTIEDGTFCSNRAYMGGGAYITDGATLTIMGGCFTDNEAIVDAAHPGNETTAFKCNHPKTSRPGFGGGVYLGSGKDKATELICTGKPDEDTDVAVYGNIAARGGDDIVCNGDFTILTLPTAQLYDDNDNKYEWFEDYNPADANYPDIMGGNVPERYRTAEVTGQQVRMDFDQHPEALEKYLCLTLGVTTEKDPVSLWITDHFDAGDGLMHLQFEPLFENAGDLAPEWIAAAKRHNWLFYAQGKDEAELSVACTNGPWQSILGFPQGLQETKGRLWVTVSNALPRVESDDVKRLSKLIIDSFVPAYTGQVIEASQPNVSEIVKDGTYAYVFSRSQEPNRMRLTRPARIRNILMVGGGGAGGNACGGGGGGGKVLLLGEEQLGNDILPSGELSIVKVGAGGTTNQTEVLTEQGYKSRFWATPGANGSASTIYFRKKSYVAPGGGGGASRTGGAGRDGGSGGGGAGKDKNNYLGGRSVGKGMGNPGGASKPSNDDRCGSGGGGGAMEPGGDVQGSASSPTSGKGGEGYTFDFTGEVYGSGGNGGGGYYANPNSITATHGGQGGVAGQYGTVGFDGEDGFGAGGGGGSLHSVGPKGWRGGRGGDGVVIVVLEPED